VQIVAPINVIAVENITGVGNVVTTLKSIYNWTAIHAVFCSALQICVKNVHGVFTQITVKAPIAVFGME
jgi:hypothetical protein